MRGVAGLGMCKVHLIYSLRQIPKGVDTRPTTFKVPLGFV